MKKDGQFHPVYVAAVILLLAAADGLAGPVRHCNVQMAEDFASAQVSNDLWLAPLDDAPQTDPSHQRVQSTFQMINDTDRTMVPLPSGEWTGLACLIGLALFRGRKLIWKIFT